MYQVLHITRAVLDSPEKKNLVYVLQKWQNNNHPMDGGHHMAQDDSDNFSDVWYLHSRQL